jgi:hypothetical protein
MALLYSTPVSLYRDALESEIEKIFSVGIIPEDFLGEIFDKIGVIQLSAGYDDSSQKWSFAGSFEIDGEISLSLPGLDFFKLILGANPNLGSNNLMVNIAIGFENGILSVSLLDIDVILELTGNSFMQSLQADATGAYTIGSSSYAPSTTEPIRLYTEQGFNLTFTSEGSISITGPEGWTLEPFCLPALGLGFELHNILIRLSTQDALPDTLAGLGFDADWVGVYIAEFGLSFAESSFLGKIVDDLTFSDFAIGRGGFSGTIAAGPWTPVLNSTGDGFNAGYGVTDLFGIPLAVESVSIQIKENSFVNCAITGQLLLPFFDAPLQVTISLTNDGDFTVAVASAGEALTLSIPDVLELEVEAISFAKEGDELLVGISGAITPTLAGIDNWPRFELKGLTISSSGKVQVEGGWIELPEQKALDFHGFKIEISQLGFGTEAVDGADWRWIGFSGGIQIVSGVPLEGGVDGLRLLWNPADPSQMKLAISGISVGFEIADVIKFEGHAEFIEEVIDGHNIKGFAGGVAMTIVPLNGLGLDAQFLAGRNETAGYNFFYIYLDISLPAGIPVVPPALGLYGMAGLFGYNVTVDKTPDEAWYEDFYKRSPEGVTSSSKWKPAEDNLAFGAGVTLRTLPDNGFSLSTKVLLVVLIPGPVIMIEGAATLLTRDVSDPSTFIFKILVVIDGQAGTFLANVEAQYAFPKDSAKKGYLVAIAGMAEVFFNFNNAADWHLYLGQEEPESKRIHADILSFFKANAYLMLDAGSLKTGMWIGYDFNKKYGPLKVALQAWIEGKLSVGFEPLQAKGSVTLYGNAELSAFGIGVGVSVEANVAVEVPKPLKVEADLKVTLKTPLGNPSAKISLLWEKTGDPGYPLVLKQAGAWHEKVTENQPITFGSGYSLDADGIWTGAGAASSSISWGTATTVPADSRIVLNFAKPVTDALTCTTGGFGTPDEETIGNYRYRYGLNALKLEESSNGASWADISTKLFATWQAMDAADGLSNLQLVIGANTSFEMLDELESSQSWASSFALAYPDFPCGTPYVGVWKCRDFQDKNPGDSFSPFLNVDGVVFYAAKPITVAYCDAQLKTTKGITTTAVEKAKTCIEMGTAPLGSFTASLLVSKVGFQPASAAAMKVEDKTWGRSIYYTTTGVTGTPARINFNTLQFPVAPESVEIAYRFADNSSATLRAYNQAGALLATSTVSYSPLGTQKLVMSAASGIRYITITGTIFYVVGLCYVLPQATPLPEIKVTLPLDCRSLQLSFCPNASGEIKVMALDNTVLKTVPIPTVATEQTLTISLPVQNIRAALVRGSFTLTQVCWLTPDEAAKELEWSQTQTQNAVVLSSSWAKTSADIFNPNRYYRLTVQTQAQRRKTSASTWEAAVPFTEYVQFKTGNPPGVGMTAATSTDTGSQLSYPDGGLLSTLDCYVSRTIPEAAGALDPQYRAYRSYDVGLEFNESYLPQLYIAAGYELKILLYDHNGDAVLGSTGAPAYITNLWEVFATHAESTSESYYKRIATCMSGSITSTTSTARVNLSAVTPLLISPNIQYKAQVVATNGTSEYQVYQFRFRTSAFVSFMHHAMSFIGSAWDNYRLLADPAYTASTTTLASILGSGLAEAMQYDQLMGLYALPASRPLPTVLEIATLGDAGGSNGLLLESPEPLDWDRLDISLAYNNFTGPVPLQEGDVVVAYVETKTTTSVNSQYVEILLRKATDLSGYKLCYRAASVTTESTFYTFAEGSSYAEGTLIRIYAGVAPTSPVATENTYLYAGLRAAPFSTSRTVLRLLDASGVEIYNRACIRTSLYAKKNLSIVRHSDGTRAFVFVKSSTAAWSILPAGTYRLALAWSRDIGAGTAKLLRRGYSDQELATLDFTLAALLPV